MIIPLVDFDLTPTFYCRSIAMDFLFNCST
nr:MAG TPA: hypothetical protein [Caudoviricetes sp.]